MVIVEFYTSNTKYALKACLQSGQTIDLTNLIIAMSWSDPAEEIAQRASISIANTKTEFGYLSDIIKLCTVVFIFVNEKEVFRGIVWEWEYKSALEKEITITAYNRIIYATKSKDDSYYTEGKSTQSIIEDICGRWGIQVKYEWKSHTHPKIVYSKKTISEQIFNTLDEAKRKLDGKYVIYMEQDILHIKEYGTNEDVFYFDGTNIMSTSNKLTLDEFITKVLIMGKEDKAGRAAIEHTEVGNLEYGTIQEMITRDGNTKLADAKLEAQKLIKEKGKPKETISIAAPDLPFLRKGHKIKVAAGNLSGFFFVEGVTHDATRRTMDMEVIRQWD